MRRPARPVPGTRRRCAGRVSDKYIMKGCGRDAVTDEALLSRARSDPDAFELFYRRHVERIIRFAARRTTSPHEVADLVADVFVAAISSLDHFDPGRGDAVAWLYGIANNVAANRWRVGRRRLTTDRRIAGRRLLDAVSSSPPSAPCRSANGRCSSWCTSTASSRRGRQGAGHPPTGGPHAAGAGAPTHARTDRGGAARAGHQGYCGRGTMMSDTGVDRFEQRLWTQLRPLLDEHVAIGSQPNDAMVRPPAAMGPPRSLRWPATVLVVALLLTASGLIALTRGAARGPTFAERLDDGRVRVPLDPADHRGDVAAARCRAGAARSGRAGRAADRIAERGGHLPPRQGSIRTPRACRWRRVRPETAASSPP